MRFTLYILFSDTNKIKKDYFKYIESKPIEII